MMNLNSDNYSHKEGEGTLTRMGCKLKSPKRVKISQGSYQFHKAELHIKKLRSLFMMHSRTLYALIAGSIILSIAPTSLLAKKCCNKRNNKWDYVIVGGGTAGAALAAKLSNPDSDGKYRNSVLVLEQGNDLSQNPEVIVNNPFAAAAVANDPTISTIVNTYVQGANVNPFNAFGYLEGIMWGGSSGHNYMLTVRGTQAQYDEWAALSGNPRWTYNNLLNNVMIPMEHYTPDGTIPNPAQRGFNGPTFITQEPSTENDPFTQAIEAATGIPYVSDYNDAANPELAAFASQFFVTPPYLGANSIRSYSGNSYLTGIASEGIPAIVDANGNGLNGRKLKIISGAHANRVLFSKNNTAKAVEYVLGSDRDKVITVKARKKIILSAGSIENPAILQRSGIGDATLLNSLNIPIVVANSNVGANMQNQAGPQAMFADAQTVNIPFLGGAFIGLGTTPNERTYQLIYLQGTAFFPANLADVLGFGPDNVGIHAFDVKMASRGTVQILSKDPFRQPTINFNFYNDEGGQDRAKIIEFYTVTVPAIADAAGATVVYPTPDQYAGGDDALFGAGLDTLLVAFHASSTCQMAQTAATGVVDGNLDVFGVNRLMVADNSVVPVINKGNTSYTALVVGLEAARIIRGS